MATNGKKLSLFLLIVISLLSSTQFTHARVRKSFSKVTHHTVTHINVPTPVPFPEELAPSPVTDTTPAPAPAQDITPASAPAPTFYETRLGYGLYGQDSDQSTPTTTSNDFEDEEDLNNESLYSNNNYNNGYGSNYDNNFPNEFSGYERERQGMSDTRYVENAKYYHNTKNENNNNNYNYDNYYHGGNNDDHPNEYSTMEEYENQEYQKNQEYVP